MLVAPEVHWNTGNIGRTCLGAGAHLHLVRPLGFSLDGKQVKRAGLDYWDKVSLKVWDDFDTFLSEMKPGDNEVAVLTKTADRLIWEMPSPRRYFLVFGSETRGLPVSILEAYRHVAYRIPITDDIRCLNLSTAAGIALYHSLQPV